ncbi:MAG: aldehyde dehydrogenase (NADP(+)) [Bacteroidetes bacterium]|nr:MAG: aldehyde dehydrogenase (NADP(+)) [Bacteroidota bacterium]
MKLHGQNSIAGQLSALGHTHFQGINPQTGAPLEGDFAFATKNEIDHALTAAQEAFRTYRRTTPQQRADFLKSIGAQITALGATLIERAMAETGLPQARLEGERGRTVGQLNKFAETLLEGSWVQARIDTAQPDRQPVPKPDVRSMYMPLGPVAVFGASNFPLAFSVAGGDTASALAAGCPVIVKAHPSHPGTSELVVGAINAAAKETGIPAGVFSMVHGGAEESKYLVRHRELKAVGFTGSFRAGRTLFDLAAGRPEPIPVYAEMGSVNPVIILPDFLKTKGSELAPGLCGSITLGVGQFCTNPGLVLTAGKTGLPQFLEVLGKNIQETPPGTMLNSGIESAYLTGLDRLENTSGVTVVAKSQTGANPGQGAPAVLQVPAAAFLDDNSLQEEVFGPSSLVVTSQDADELYQVIGQLHGQLTATVYGTEKDFKNFPDLIDYLAQKAGRLLFGGFPTGVEVCDAMVHGGPYPATTDARSTSVGTAAIFRFVRPVAFQNFPETLLPEELKEDNPRRIWRMENGHWHLPE